MALRTLTSILLSFSVFISANAIGLNHSTDNVVAIEVIAAREDGFSLKFDFPDLEFTTVESGGETFTEIIIPGCGEIENIGKSALPAFSKLIRLPRTGGYSLKVTLSEPQIYNEIIVRPAQPLDIDGKEKPDFTLDSDFYLTDVNYPDKNADGGEIAVWRDIRVAPVNIYPAQYNPARKELKFYRSVTVEITYTEHGENELTLPQRPLSEAFRPLYEAVSIGPEGAELDLPAERGSYLIITPPNYLGYLTQWAEWKTRMGYSAVIATTTETGTSFGSIKTYVYEAYNEWEVPPDYLVLVGDEDSGMPTYFIAGSYYPWDAADHEYVLLEGTDYFPEMFVGRLSVDNTTQLQAIINKMNNYEKDPYMGNTAWFGRALMIADYTGAESCRYTKEFCEDQLEYEGYGEVENTYYPGAQTSQIAQEINQGVSFVNYRGYGGSTYWTLNMWNHWDVGDVQNLQNGWMAPVVTSMVCGGGNFSYSNDPCFGEAWIREAQKGAVAFCGPSEVDTHTKWNNNLDCGLYWGMFRENLHHFGPALLYAKMELWLDYPHCRSGVGTPTNSVGFYFYVYNLLGDPGLNMWSGVPEIISADFQQPFPLGMNQFDAVVTDASGNPVEDAYVCIWKDSEIYEGGKTLSDGSVSLPVADYNPGTMKLTVTGKNLKPLLENVEIEQQEVMVGISSLTIDDDPAGGTYGNDDGMLSPGETADLIVTAKNYGSSITAQNIQASLTTVSPNILIEQVVQQFGNLSPQQSGVQTYRISLHPSFTVYDDPGLKINFACPQGEWLQTVFVPVSDAEFLPLDYEFNPASLEPGQQSELVVTIENAGLCNTNAVNGILTSLDPLISVITGTAGFGNILSGAQGSNTLQPFLVAADSAAFPGRIAHLQLNFSTAEGYQPSTDMLVRIGEVQTTDPMGPDAYGYYCFDSNDLGYSKVPVYDWLELYNNGGILLNLPDYGDEQDCRVTVDLPFDFVYYGEEYSQISVCSNGYISMGISDIVQFRNKAIPSAMGPPAMISAFWDDLKMSSTSTYGNVFKYYDSANHRFIIEYHDVRNDYNNSNECFQIILHDPDFYPTPTGDGEIVFMYEDVNDVDASDNFTTVGIEDWGHTTGLQYVFSDIYPASSHELQDTLALKFTTDPGQYAASSLALTFEPENPPVIIPASGGSFNYQVILENNGSAAEVVDFWTEVTLPAGTVISPVIFRPDVALNPGALISRLISQTIPAGAPSGIYTFTANMGDFNTGNIVVTQNFNIEKLSSE